MSSKLDSIGEFIRKKFSDFAPFLNALADGQQYADDLAVSRWEFAVAMKEAQTFKLSRNDLKWMILRGWILHSNDSNLDVVANGEQISDRSSFVITDAGIEAISVLRDSDTQSAAYNPTLRLPKWNSDRHELCFRGLVVKRFRWPALNQEMILEVFEEEGWPERIDDPLSRIGDIDPKRRLSDAIKCLNRNQAANLLRFRGDGTGEGVLWDVLNSDFASDAKESPEMPPPVFFSTAKRH